MEQRHPPLEEFITAARAAFTDYASDHRSKASLAKIFGAVEEFRGVLVDERVKLPVSTYLHDALTPRPEPVRLLRLVDAFLDLEPELSWRKRPTYDPKTASDNFLEGHGNCTVLGPDGLERRSDLIIGASLLAPNVRYPDHDHSPEETYLMVSEGLFQQGDGSWFSPGTGGSFYNAPMIRHAMRSGEKPLFAFWALWLG